ncbi:MAG: hypothetical protein OSA84_10665 [Akkermansiaceae bacterium]|nr:hypothetical protein [Akkermansiaceae bacterium]
MRIPLILLACSACLSFGAERTPEDDRAAASVEERRGIALSEKMDRFETMKGRVYEDVRITAIDAGGVSLSHSSGTARLRYGDLSPQQRRNFGMDATAAAETYRNERLAREAYDKRVEEKQIARREVAEKATEERRLGWEKAAAARALAEANREPSAEETIPLRPNIQRIDSGRRSTRHSRSSNYYGYFPSSYCRSYSGSRHYSTGYRYSRAGCRTGTPGFVIRF